MSKELIGLLVCCALALIALVYVLRKAGKYQESKPDEAEEPQAINTSIDEFNERGYRITDHLYFINDEKYVVYESKNGAYFVFRKRKRDNSTYRMYINASDIL